MTLIARTNRTQSSSSLSWRSLLIVTSALVGWSGGASAYIGDSFLEIPGSAGHWTGRDHKHWIRAEASDWPGMLRRIMSGGGDFLAGNKLFFGGPGAPHPGGSGTLVIALAKSNPDLEQLRALCAHETSIAQLTYAESSDRSRPILELGPRPASFPDFWEYRLKNVQVSACPDVSDASQQAFVLSFEDVEWLNYDPKGPAGNKVAVNPRDLPKVEVAPTSGKTQTRTFVVNWIAPATDSDERSCPVLNTKPTEQDVFRYLSPEEVAKERAKNGEKGITFGGQSERRGPDKLNAVLLPGIVPDPGFIEPKSSVAEGLDLDGDDGSGNPPRSVCKHKNYVSADGRTGIDNQFFTVSACVAGLRGKQGYRNQTSNARRADGNIVTLVQVSGIRNEKNDTHVTVSIIYSRDKPIRDAAGRYVANYTFRPTENPNFALYNLKVRGRMVNAVVTTDVIPKFQMNLGQDPLLQLANARLRLEFLPDGSMKATLGGYRDWKEIAMGSASGYSEGLFAYQMPGLYYSLKRNADGLKDPVTGECTGISMAYEIDAVPAFLAPDTTPQVKTAQVANTGPGVAH
jgi:hypothetical protein